MSNTERIVYERNDVRVLVALRHDGTGGLVFPERRGHNPAKANHVDWVCIRDDGNGANPYCFKIPGGRWPWNRSMDRAIMLGVRLVQRDLEQRMTAAQRLEVAAEELSALFESSLLEAL